MKLLNSMPTHGYIPLAVVLLFTATAVSSYAASAKEDSSDVSGLPTFRSSVDQVEVTFFATDANDRPLESLTPSDFAVVDNERVVRNFKSFARPEDSALDVLALVDVSGSVAPRLQGVINAVQLLVAREQSNSALTTSVLSFGGLKTAGLCSSNCRAADALRSLATVNTGAATPLFDALIFAADFSSRHRRSGARPVLLLFSDGNDTISLHSPREAIQALTGSGIIIYSVDIGTPQNSRAGSMFLRQLSDATGGRYFAPRDLQANGAAAVLDAVLEDRSSSFIVTYDVPSREPGFHSLRLLPTRNLNLTFHNRNGYNYEPRVR
jgi:VWFA-related protein